MKFCLLLLDFKIHHTSTVFNKSTAIKNGLLYIQPLIRVIGYLKRSTFSALPMAGQSGYDFVSEKAILSFLDMSEKGMSF